MSTWKNGKGRDAVVEVLATMKMGEDYFSEESKDATMKFLEKDLKQEAMKAKLLIARENKKRDKCEKYFKKLHEVIKSSRYT